MTTSESVIVNNTLSLGISCFNLYWFCFTYSVSHFHNSLNLCQFIHGHELCQLKTAIRSCIPATFLSCILFFPEKKVYLSGFRQKNVFRYTLCLVFPVIWADLENILACCLLTHPSQYFSLPFQW